MNTLLSIAHFRSTQLDNGVNSFWQDYKEFMYDNGLDLHIENVWAFLEEHGRVDSFSERDLEEARNEAAEEAYEIGREEGYDIGYYSAREIYENL